MTLRPPLERMGARESMFGLVERCTSWFRKSFPWAFFESHSIVELVQVYTGGFQAGLPHGQATLEHPSGWRFWFYLSRISIRIVSFNMLQICGGICGGEDAWGGNVYLGGRSNLSGAVQQRADDWRRKVGQCQTWTKYKVYVDTSRLMEESLRTASTILMATTRLWATRLSLMVSLSSERCYFLWVHPEVRRMYHILLW